MKESKVLLQDSLATKSKFRKLDYIKEPKQPPKHLRRFTTRLNKKASQMEYERIINSINRNLLDRQQNRDLIVTNPITSKQGSSKRDMVTHSPPQTKDAETIEESFELPHNESVDRSPEIEQKSSQAMLIREKSNSELTNAKVKSALSVIYS